MKKIHIIGSTGSGKTYISREISRRFGINHYDLDNIVWRRDDIGGKLPEEVRDLRFNEILNNNCWVLEGVYHKWIGKSLKSADLIVFLDPNVYLRDYRIILRFIKTRLKLEPSNYKQRLNDLIKMIKWNHKFERTNKIEISSILTNYQEKVIIIKNNKDLMKVFQ